ncbi:MAG: hypothetical protein DMD83_17810 [Candidatus Rokuibacteriota bacterium]|nr:MAG: hypothetical protein DMD83_17810 [Candidatus Rokubacteria bacterium]
MPSSAGACGIMLRRTASTRIGVFPSWDQMRKSATWMSMFRRRARTVDEFYRWLDRRAITGCRAVDGRHEQGA